MNMIKKACKNPSPSQRRRRKEKADAISLPDLIKRARHSTTFGPFTDPHACGDTREQVRREKDVLREQVRRVVKRLADHGWVEMASRKGKHGPVVYVSLAVEAKQKRNVRDATRTESVAAKLQHHHVAAKSGNASTNQPLNWLHVRPLYEKVERTWVININTPKGDGSHRQDEIATTALPYIDSLTAKQRSYSGELVLISPPPGQPASPPVQHHCQETTEDVQRLHHHLTEQPRVRAVTTKKRSNRR